MNEYKFWIKDNFICFLSQTHLSSTGEFEFTEQQQQGAIVFLLGDSALNILRQTYLREPEREIKSTDHFYLSL